MQGSADRTTAEAPDLCGKVDVFSEVGAGGGQGAGTQNKDMHFSANEARGAAWIVLVRVAVTVGRSV